MLLSNGDILVQGTPTLTQANVGPADVWYRLTPDSTGNYVLGSWGSQSHMNVPRLYSPTAMLPEGIIVVGGEYSLPFSFTNAVEIYDPTTNSWSQVASVPTPPTQTGQIPPPNAISQFGDDPITVLPNGQVLAGYFNGPQTYIYNPATNSWRQTTGDKLAPMPTTRKRGSSCPTAASCRTTYSRAKRTAFSKVSDSFRHKINRSMRAFAIR